MVKCSNFIGDALDIAALEGFRSVLLIGHFGKLVKLAAGVMNTHSRFADARLESITAHAALCGADAAVCRALMQQVTTDGCLTILDEAGLRQAAMDRAARRIEILMEQKFAPLETGAVLFSNVYGVLCRTSCAEALLQHIILEPQNNL